MKSVCAGIVTYNPNMELLKQCFNAIYSQVNYVFIYDNGSKNSKQLEILASYKNLKIIYSDENVGIAKALNELCKQASEAEYKWIVTMDQDSICADNMVEELFKYENEDKYGIICPRVEFKSGEQLIYKTKEKEEVTRVRACITSGGLTRISAWEKVGGFDEWMFIDHVDNEFCTHLYVEGFSVVRVNNAVLYQRAGEMKYISLIGGRKLLLPYYSEFRNYYICRNTVYYIRKYKKYINVRHELMTFIYSQLIKLLFERGRWKTVRSSYMGIKAGLEKKCI